ncbi:MAG: hypothetical protein ACR2PR_08165 [Pseudohongiellaceae bacterium]
MPDFKLADLQRAIEMILDKRLDPNDESAELRALARRNGIRYTTMDRATRVIRDLRNERSTA